MPTFEYTTVLGSPPSVVFDFLARPRNALLVAPPSPKIEFLAGPERLELGSRFTVRMGKFGLWRELVSKVTQFEEGVSFTDAQEAGPFQHWAHTHTLTALGPGTTMTDRIEVEAPKGWLGWFLTNSQIMQGLRTAFVYREERFREVLGE